MGTALENIRRVFAYPIARLILRGGAKALVVALAASVLLASFLVYWIYGPDFDFNFHVIGTADKFFKFALILITRVSIPVAFVAEIIVSIILRLDGMKRCISFKQSFIKGFAIGGALGCVGLLIFGDGIVNAFLFIVVFIFASLAGGVGALWMTKNALELFQSNLGPNL